LAHGLFLPLTRDELKPASSDPRAEWLSEFLSSDRTDDSAAADRAALARHHRLRDVYRQFMSLGRQLAAREAGTTFRTIFTGLACSRRDPRATVAKIALAHGLLAGDQDDDGRARDERLLHRFLVYGIGPRTSIRDHLRVRAAHLVGRVRRASRANSRVRW
jgi:hypothetical protein